MTDQPTTADTATDKVVDLRRRAKRGFIAGYVHGLSARHNGADAREQAPAEDATRPLEGA
jgi:hypothetical protein